MIELGERVTWRAKHFWIWHELTSEIVRLQSPTYFRDVMVRGIFRSMTHDHYFRQLAGGQTEMRDIFTFAAPLPPLGRIAEAMFLGRYMRQLLRKRKSGKLLSRTNGGVTFHERCVALGRISPPPKNQAAAPSESSSVSSPAAFRRSTVSWQRKQ